MKTYKKTLHDIAITMWWWNVVILIASYMFLYISTSGDILYIHVLFHHHVTNYMHVYCQIFTFYYFIGCHTNPTYKYFTTPYLAVFDKYFGMLAKHWLYVSPTSQLW